MENCSRNSRYVFEKRYLLKDADGRLLETIEGLFNRVATAVASAELKFNPHGNTRKWKNAFYQMLASFDYLPNSPTLMNAGTSMGQLSACFVLPVKDDLESIFDTLKYAALIQQSGGGTGFNFSGLRAEGDFVKKTGGTSSGPVSFIKLFDAATENIKQGGKRRGANMGILNDNHPDILTFINAKNEPHTLTNFNLSIGVSDLFMEAVEADREWTLVHPINQTKVRQLPARTLWDQIVLSAWKTGDPGLVFIDAINRANPLPQLGRIEATNPCGEVPLLPYEACNLGSINLSRMLKGYDEQWSIDWQKLKKTVFLAIRFLDNSIEINNYLIQETKKMVQDNRKIGLGVMGWAEMLIQLRIPYDSEEAVLLGERLMKFINDCSFEASAELAKTRGTFPNWEKSVYYPNRPVRNATRTSIAPTGTISILADTTASIEPLFALMYERQEILDGDTLPEINRLLLEIISKKMISGETLAHIAAEGEMSLKNKLPDDVRTLFSTALSISPKYHIRHQIAFQKYTDNAVSKTINLPETASIEDVSEAYKLAWRSNAKGITVYRYNSKTHQVLNTMDSNIACKRCA